jgi:hypothetical protein
LRWQEEWLRQDATSYWKIASIIGRSTSILRDTRPHFYQRIRAV